MDNDSHKNSTKDSANECWIPILKISCNDNGNKDENKSSIIRGTFAFGGRAVACGTDRGQIFVHTLETGQRILSLKKNRSDVNFLGTEDKGVNDIKSDETGNYLAACFSSGIINIYDLRIGLENKGSLSNSGIVRFENAHKGACTSISVPEKWFSQPFHSGGYDGYIRSWDPRKEEYISQVLSHEAPVLSLEKSSDNKVLSSTSFDGKVRIWKSSNLQLLKTFSGPQGSNCSLHSTFSSDDEHLLCTGNSSSCIWSFGRGKILEKKISWGIPIEKETKDYFNKDTCKDGLIPLFTGFSTIWKDRVFVPKVCPLETIIGEAFVFDLYTAEYLYSLPSVSSRNSITTSISKHPDLSCDIIITTSSLPESSLTLWSLGDCI
ncbi:WD-40 repeat-containing protein [Cryptosporidium felis]|nr:WD-40 repeat-containing protein [Cryptosporidium felis]